jgi:hypothetical protein
LTGVSEVRPGEHQLAFPRLISIVSQTLLGAEVAPTAEDTAYRGRTGKTGINIPLMVTEYIDAN